MAFGKHAEAKNEISATDFVSQQKQLEEEARELMPWEPKNCTYELGSIRQQVYACRTHNKIGLCYSCSILCHTSCDIVELFTKRHFTCDCGTERDTKEQNENGVYCDVRKNRERDIASHTNIYHQNFDGLFCGCKTEYDPENPAVMLQCVLGLTCGEDWFHDYCILGKNKEESDKLRAKTATEHDEETPLDGIPALDTFEAFICWKCTKKYEHYFKRILSHPLADELIVKIVTQSETATEDTQKKRKCSDDSDNYSIFLKKDYEKIFEKMKNDSNEDGSKISIFLRDIAPHLISDEPVYEPPEEQEDELSIESLTRKILQETLHRQTAVEGLSALNSLKDRLSTFLKPFAETGKTVKEEDIVTFFGSDK
ncbi:hypothetical protein RNJ44_04914 [Nakaseomyces bracarensis]|uniref:UBR-type domain-containing protein n=1 Tax=Nakaseomyces bracarensis TaxID=273131 RepID=A0ABR4NWD9_9SACH